MGESLKYNIREHSEILKENLTLLFFYVRAHEMQ